MSWNKWERNRAGADIVMAATGSSVVTPTDALLSAGIIIRAITIANPGTVRWLDTDLVIQNTDVLPAGTYAMQARGIYATGTTATGITAWF